YLGVRLLNRGTRSVTLTRIGASYAAEVREVLDHLATATLAASGQQSSGTLNVSTVDSFAAKWLVPRLFRFRRAHGDIDIRLSTSEAFADFASDGIEIAVR